MKTRHLTEDHLFYIKRKTWHLTEDHLLYWSEGHARNCDVASAENVYTVKKFKQTIYS